MAAGTAYSSLTSATDLGFGKRAAKVNNSRYVAPLRPGGIYTFDTGALTVATTNIDDVNDELRLLRFPDRCFLLALQVTATDMDTNGAPTLSFDVQIDNNTAEVDLIANSTIGRTGGSDELDINAGHILRDVSLNWLQIKVDAAAATGAAGTIRAKGVVLINQSLSDLIFQSKNA